MKIGLFFGSFNPIHTGHLIIANYFASNTDLHEVWFVVSPQNPFKEKSSLLGEYDRLHLVNLAVEDNYLLRSSNIEFSLPKPSYTIDTLTYLKEKYPEKTFCLIMGSDNLQSLPKWKNAPVLIKNYEIYVYNRKGYNTEIPTQNNSVKVFDLPLLDISASKIRQLIARGMSVKYMVPDKALTYIENMGYYRK